MSIFIPFFKKKLQNDDFVHVIITHFNLDYSKTFKTVPLGQYKNPEWLKERFYLFENFCLPSMLSQTDKNFIWLCTFHKETPEPFLSKIKEYHEKCPQMEVIFYDEYSKYRQNIVNIIKDKVEQKSYLVTTRLDNDDSFAIDYIENIHKHLYQTKKGYFIDFIYGYIYDTQNKEVHYQKFRRNPFSSRVEKWEFAKTVRMCAHDIINKYGDVHVVNSKPMWIQNIHGGNVLNQVDGPIQKDLTDFKTRFIIND